jgi:hypothetical protein
MSTLKRRIFRVILGAAALWVPIACFAQQVPVSVSVSGNVVTARVGQPLLPLADVILTFDDASALTSQSIGISAELVDPANALLLSRLPGAPLTLPTRELPLLLTIEPPASAGLSFKRTVTVEIHTRLLPYTAGSSFRLFKAPLGGDFRDITREVLPGSVRTRGTSGAFSQFLLIVDVRPTDYVIDEKFAWTRSVTARLPKKEREPLDAYLAAASTATDAGRYADAIAALDAFSARVASRSGKFIPDTWRARRDLDNQAGELLSGAATLKFSIGYLRDFGR